MLIIKKMNNKCQRVCYDSVQQDPEAATGETGNPGLSTVAAFGSFYINAVKNKILV